MVVDGMSCSDEEELGLGGFDSSEDSDSGCGSGERKSRNLKCLVEASSDVRGIKSSEVG